MRLRTCRPLRRTRHDRSPATGQGRAPAERAEPAGSARMAAVSP